MTKKKVAVLIDAGFAKIALAKKLGKQAAAADFEHLVHSDIMGHAKLDGTELYRAYFYDAAPYAGKVTNPIDQTRTNLKNTPTYTNNSQLHQQIQQCEWFALRLGECRAQGWELNHHYLKQIKQSATPNTTLAPGDLKPRLSQKGVDMRIGLDIAWMATKQLVDIMVLVTADSDFIPAMKFARKEGIAVAMMNMGNPI